MKSTQWLKVVLCAVVVVGATAAFAQGGGGGGRGGRGGMQGGRMGMMGGDNSLQLLNRADVQRDLALTQEQKDKLAALQARQREEMQAVFEQMRNSGGQPDREAMQKVFTDMQAKQKGEIEKILNADQTKRLGQIRVQLAGNRAVMMPDVQKELGVTDAQRASLQALQAKQQEANQALMEKVRNQEISREEFQASREKNEKILADEIGKILTDAQRAKLKEMGGKEFKADPPQRGGGR